LTSHVQNTCQNGAFKIEEHHETTINKAKFKVVTFMPLSFTQAKTLLVNWNSAKKGLASFAKAISLIFLTSNKPIMT
jgi:hypothetical protein